MMAKHDPPSECFSVKIGELVAHRVPEMEVGVAEQVAPEVPAARTGLYLWCSPHVRKQSSAHYRTLRDRQFVEQVKHMYTV